MKTLRFFHDLTLEEIETSAALARSATYLRCIATENPLYPMVAKLLEELANKKLNTGLKRADANPTP